LSLNNGKNANPKIPASMGIKRIPVTEIGEGVFYDSSVNSKKPN
jgi:hypothetical protein